MQAFDPPPQRLHVQAFDPQWQRSKSFKPHRKKMNGPLYNSEHGAALRREFARFVCEFLAPHIREHTQCRRVYFQSTPSLRIQPPSNNRIGYPHTGAASRRAGVAVAAAASAPPRLRLRRCWGAGGAALGLREEKRYQCVPKDL